MDIRTGIDICDPARIKRAVMRHGQRFTNKIFTAGELGYCSSMKNPYPSYAVRFAVKEAGMKLLGAGIGAIGFKEIEVMIEPSGRPSLTLHGNARKIADEMGVVSIDISLSHEKTMAVAVVTGLFQKR